jgi:MoxR-like ATPase
MATQNPIEQEGTYPLPEAQVDRFMLKLKLDYPNRKEEREILERMSIEDVPRASRATGPVEILSARKVVEEVYMDDRIKEYILSIVFATRQPSEFGLDLAELIEYGGSPRATLYLAQAARAHAFIRGRGYVTPEDVKSIGPDVLRHRVILSFEAEAENVTAEEIVQRIFDTVEVP